jgi:hypothetical protein
MYWPPCTALRYVLATHVQYCANVLATMKPRQRQLMGEQAATVLCHVLVTHARYFASVLVAHVHYSAYAYSSNVLARHAQYSANVLVAHVQYFASVLVAHVVLR